MQRVAFFPLAESGGTTFENPADLSAYIGILQCAGRIGYCWESVITALAGRNAFQGILIEQDEDDWLRFDIVTNGTNYSGFAARRAGGVPTVKLNVSLGAEPSPPAIWLRVTRVGDSWTFAVSTNGTIFAAVGPAFNEAIAVTNVGVMAGNALDNPGFTARFDYFFESSSPIVPER